MNTLSKTLEDIGFTPGESAVYLSLLRLGESKVGPIIVFSKISRSKVYDILERLINKGVVSKIEKNNVLYYQALSPKAILSYIHEKEKLLHEEAQLLQEALPSLMNLAPERAYDIKVYEGDVGFKAMIQRTLEEIKQTDTYYAMGISKTTEFMRTYALKIYQAQKKKHFKALSIFDEEGKHKALERKNRWHDIRILPHGQRTPVLFTIYSDTVGIHLGKGEIILSLVVKQKDIAQSFLTSFDALWRIAKPLD